MKIFSSKKQPFFSSLGRRPPKSSFIFVREKIEEGEETETPFRI